MTFEIPSWEDITNYLRELAQKIIQNRIKINVIVCIGRGGACPSRILSDFLNIPIFYNISVSYYNDIGEKNDSPLITQPLSVSLSGKHVLLCDDVSDSGNSFRIVKGYLEKQKCAAITTAAIYMKPWTSFIPNFYAKATEAWIVFPWEQIETLDKLIQRHLKEGKPLEDITSELLSAGFTNTQLEFYFSIRPRKTDQINKR